MNILALDTSGRHLSLALRTEKGLVMEHNERLEDTLAEHLPGDIKNHVLPHIGDLRNLDAIGVCIGPGPFTSVRIGLSLCKALIVSLHLPFLPVHSLRAMAGPYLDRFDTTAAIMDAKRSEFYAAVYRSVGEEVLEICPPALVCEMDLVDWLKPCAPTRLIGLMSEQSASRFRSAGFTVLHVEPYLAREIARLTVECPHRWLRDSQLLSPLYLREPDAVAKKQD